MEFLYLLEKIRFPGLNEVMLLVTLLGEQTAFLLVTLVLFWCVDKRKGYYIMTVCFIGTLANQFMKLWFRVPRPWVLDKNFTIVEQAREAASGYSFPSGHTQCAVGYFGGIAFTEKNRFIRVGAVALAVLAAFSRMYLGVHTPLDVFVSVAIALLLIVFLRPAFFGKQKFPIPVLFSAMVLGSVAFIVFVKCYSFPVDVDAENLASGTESAFTLLGALMGMLCVYIVDEKWLKFPTKAVWWAQIIKVLVGAVIVLTVKEGLRDPLIWMAEWIFEGINAELVARAVRYFLCVVVAGSVWPISFHFFSKLGKKGE